MPELTVKSPYETLSDWEKRTFCDNASRRGTGVSLSPQCPDGKREYECTVIYNEVEKDTMVLCAECRKHLMREARKHGYKVHSKKL